MYAVVRTGGKQYRVAKDSVLKVESLVGDVGSKLTLGEVLMLAGNVGNAPFFLWPWSRLMTRVRGPSMRSAARPPPRMGRPTSACSRNVPPIR